MPVYDFRCFDCRTKFEKQISFTDYDNYKAICPVCSSNNVKRIIRKVRFSLGDRSRLATLADPSNLDALNEDPRALGKMMREMSGQICTEDLPGEFHEVVDRLEKGQSPDEIERNLPELSGDISEE